MSGVDTRVRKASWALLGIAVSGLVGSLLVGVIVVAQIRGTQVDNARRSANDAQTLQIIKDCTQPSGSCYKRGEARTASVLSSVQRIIVLSAACAVSEDPNEPVASRVADITACVTKGLRR